MKNTLADLHRATLDGMDRIPGKTFVVKVTALSILFSLLSSLMKFDQGRPTSDAHSCDVERIADEGSAVSCDERPNHSGKSCSFLNLCYSPRHEQFIYVNSSTSEPHSSILDMKVSPAASEYFTYATISNEHLAREYSDNLLLLRGKHILVHRSSQDDLFTIFHGDLLPICHTLLQYELLLNPSVTVIFVDNFAGNGKNRELYQIFSETGTRHIRDFSCHGDCLLCFEESVVGLVEDSMWHKDNKDSSNPRGNIEQVTRSVTTSFHIRSFTHHMLRAMSVFTDCPNEEYGVIFHPNGNPITKHAEKIKAAIFNAFEMEIVQLARETNSTEYILRTLLCAKLMVCFCGEDSSIYAMFLPMSSVLMEVCSDNAGGDPYESPYKKIAGLTGMEIGYVTHYLGQPTADYDSEDNIGHTSNENHPNMNRSGTTTDNVNAISTSLGLVKALKGGTSLINEKIASRRRKGKYFFAQLVSHATSKFSSSSLRLSWKLPTVDPRILLGEVVTYSLNLVLEDIVTRETIARRNYTLPTTTITINHPESMEVVGYALISASIGPNKGKAGKFKIRGKN